MSRGVLCAASAVIGTLGVAPVPAQALVLGGPDARAMGVSIPLEVSGGQAGEAVSVQLRRGSAWVVLQRATLDDVGRARLPYQPLRRSSRYVLRAVSESGAVSSAHVVRARDVVLASFGDANLGDGVASVMASRGVLWPWRSVGPVLRAADIAFGNLECAVSLRGFPVPKQFNFRGRPSALRAIARFAGLDVLNLANNHAGDYGRLALLDTVRSVRSAGALPVGAGATIVAARRPAVVTRLGLRVAFVGFSDIGPGSFAAGPRSPGTAFASPAVIRSGVRAAEARADVVVVTFHWGVERATRENGRQRAFARQALAAGADAVIGAHPHVLQPLRDPGGHRVIAYSLGNFVWAAGSSLTARTGILRLHLSARGVEHSRLLRARIVGTRPRLTG